MAWVQGLSFLGLEILRSIAAWGAPALQSRGLGCRGCLGPDDTGPEAKQAKKAKSNAQVTVNLDHNDGQLLKIGKEKVALDGFTEDQGLGAGSFEICSAVLWKSATELPAVVGLLAAPFSAEPRAGFLRISKRPLKYPVPQAKKSLEVPGCG